MIKEVKDYSCDKL